MRVTDPKKQRPDYSRKPMTESRARTAVLALLLCMFAILWISGERALANTMGWEHSPEVAVQTAQEVEPWEFPNGGEMAPHRVTQTPSGAWEVTPLRCTYWEDGSVLCPAYEVTP